MLPAAAAEIRHWAGHPNFVQVLLLSRTAEPLGNRRYWPIYEAAAERRPARRPSTPSAMAASRSPAAAGPAITSRKWSGTPRTCQAGLASMIVEGVFERFPDLKVRHGRSRLRLGAVAGLAAGQGLEAAAGRDAAPEATAQRIYAPARLVDDPADGGAGAARASARHHRLDGLGSAVVRDRLSRIGTTTIRPMRCRCRIAEADRQAFFLGNARGVYGVSE